MMAVELHSRDSLLHRSELVNEENNGRSNYNFSMSNNKPVNQTWSSCLSNSSDFGSASSSPIASEFGSTKSDSDQEEEEEEEDDYTAELTRQMAHYMLQDDEDAPENKDWGEEDVARTRKFENLKEERCLATCLEPTNSVSLPTNKTSSSYLEFQSRQALIDSQIRAIQLYKLKQQKSMYWDKQIKGYKKIEFNEQFHQNKGRGCNGQRVSWTNQQQQQRTGSEMTAFFLGEPGSRSGSSCGTGVFLPRGINSACEPRKKPGCSTVLIPAKVVQALKLQFERLGIESSSSLPNQLQDGSMENVMYSEQMKKHSHSMKNEDMGLPQEWTY